MAVNSSRETLFRWAGWFAFANSLVFGLVSLRYLSGGVALESLLSVIYLVSVYIGHHVILSALPMAILAVPFILLYPRRRVLMALAIFTFALLMALMVLDSLLWSQSRFHINALTMKILGWQSWVFAIVFFGIGVVFESILARSVWNWVEAKKQRFGWATGFFCGVMIILSQGIHAWADAAYHVPVTSLGQQLPVYKGMTAKSFMTKAGLVDVKEARERSLARRISRGLDQSGSMLLNYPLHPMQCAQEEALNLVLIVADSVRASVLTPELMPNVYQFSRERGIRFTNHFSGGNSSRMGMFSLFYGLPPGYWSSFVSVARPTVLVEELQAQDYQLGLFSSATMYRPVQMDRTVFAHVPDLRMGTEPSTDPPWKRDKTVNREWFEWLDNRDHEKPFFGFLFYDSTTEKSVPPGYPLPVISLEDEFLKEQVARYQGSVHFVDELAGAVLADLEKRGLVENTVILFTSDHGEEFGESDPNLTKHGSGFTRHQLMTPMVIFWPGRLPAVFDHRSSHYDIVPTLMQELLGCSNPATDYSAGNNLFEGREWDWIVAGSYYNYAVIEPDQVTVTFPTGTFEVRDLDHNLLENPRFRGDVLEAVSEQNSRFFAE